MSEIERVIAQMRQYVHTGDKGNECRVMGNTLLVWADRLERAIASEDRDAEVSETQIGISQWADKTFGPAGSNARVAARANEEMAELLRALTVDDNHPKAAEELADVVIIVYRLATRLGIDLHEEIARKMAVNRAREWKLDNTGHGYHVRDKTAT